MNIFKAYKVSDCTILLQDYFTAEDLTNISVRQCGIAIRDNIQQLIALLKQLITVENLPKIKQKLKWLNKFTQIDIPYILIESIKNNQELIKFAARLGDDDYIAITEFFDCQIYSEELLQDGKIIMKVRGRKFFEKLKIDLQSKVKPTNIDENYIIEILHYLQVSNASKILESKVMQYLQLSNYSGLQYLVDCSIKYQEMQFINTIQNIIETALKNEQLVFRLAQENINGQNLYLLESKLTTMIYYQKCYLQMAVSKYITDQKKYDSSNLEFLATLKYVDEFIIASNYYWNQGQVVQQKFEVDLPLFKVIQQKFSALPKQSHQIYQLWCVVLQVQYKGKLLYMTIQEYQILQQFQKQNTCQVSGDATRLVNLGVLSQKGKDYQINEGNLDHLTQFCFATKPATQIQQIQQDEYEQNKKLMYYSFDVVLRLGL